MRIGQVNGVHIHHEIIAAKSDIAHDRICWRGKRGCYINRKAVGVHAEMAGLPFHVLTLMGLMGGQHPVTKTPAADITSSLIVLGTRSHAKLSGSIGHPNRKDTAPAVRIGIKRVVFGI